MRRSIGIPLVIVGTLVAVVALLLTGFDVGGGGREGGSARVLVTEDFGTRVVGARVVQELPANETAMRMLQRNFDVETAYGGRYVTAIDGREGSRTGQRDWFFFVNGIGSQVGAAEVDVHPGDAIWWDRHDWSGSQRVEAVVGQFPEPFAHGFDGRRLPLVLQCAASAEEACQQVAERLTAVGALPARQTLGTNVETAVLRVLVGEWAAIRRDHALRLLDRGPQTSGVYARFADDGASLELLDPAGEVVRRLGAGAGLVAATRLGEQVPTWAVTGTDAAGVAAAAEALVADRLRNRFAVAIEPGGGDVGLPIVP